MSPDSHSEVLCAGIVVADAIAAPVDELPEQGRLALVESVELHTGGCALSTASALVKLGVSTALCGCVGDDLFGGVLAREARARGLDTRGPAHRGGRAHLRLGGARPQRRRAHVPPQPRGQRGAHRR